jgi:hypothetical protein
MLFHSSLELLTCHRSNFRLDRLNDPYVFQQRYDAANAMVRLPKLGLPPAPI